MIENRFRDTQRSATAVGMGITAQKYFWILFKSNSLYFRADYNSNQAREGWEKIAT